MRTDIGVVAVLVVAVLVTLIGGCAGGNCARTAGAGNAPAAGGETASAGTTQQGPAAHETPQHDLEFEDHTVTASPSDAPPERLTPELIEHIVLGQIPDIHQCYENALVGHPDLTGRVVVLMHIHASGNVVGAEVGENTLGENGAGVAECIVEQVDDWHFPTAAHDIAVRYPFVLVPAPAAAVTPPPA